MRLKKPVISLILLLFLLMPVKGHSICQGTFLNPITDVCWRCIFPIKIAGIPIVPSGGLEDTPDLTRLPICVCPFPPPIFFRIGIPVSFWEPARFVETVKDPYCFPSLGFGLSNPASGFLSGANSEQGTDQEDPSTFSQAHYFIFPVWTMMELLTDFACVEHTSFDVAYITEVDPLWNNDMLAFIINPEALLFANPVAQMACVADSVASNAGLPLNPLFWCMGSGGSAYPLSGHVNDDNYVQANNSIAARMIYKLGREGLLWDTATSLCTKVPSPIWIKSHYRLQIARPVRGSQCIPIGRSSLIWGAAKNPPFIGDNFLWIIFRKRACCAF